MFKVTSQRIRSNLAARHCWIALSKKAYKEYILDNKRTCFPTESHVRRLILSSYLSIKYEASARGQST